MNKYINLILALYSFTIILLLYSLYPLRKVNKKVCTPLKAAIIASIFGTICHMIIVKTFDETIARIAFTIYFFCIDVILCALFDYSRKLTNYKIKWPPFTYIYISFCFFDMISLLLNIPLGHSFEVVRMPIIKSIPSVTVFNFTTKTFYDIHLALSYISLFFTFLVLVIKFISVPKPYKFMYRAIMLILSIAILGDAIYVFTPVNVAFSMFFISISAVIVSKYTADYIPPKLITKQLKNVVCYMNDAVKIYDYEGNDIYNNVAMQSLINKVREIGYDPNKIFDGLNPKNFAPTSNLLKDREFSYDIKTENGSFSFIINVCYPKDEEGKPIGVFIIIHDRTKEVARIAEERYRATHDTLTGIYNRETFYEKVRYAFAENPEEKYLLIASDVDNFKLINDLFGKEIADEFLVRIANGIKTYTKEGEVYARLENDHFVLLMKKSDFQEIKFINLPNQVSYIAENLAYPINIHIGVYEIEDTTIPVSVMCDRAYMAIKTIKGNFRKSIAYYDDSLRNKILRQQQLISDSTIALSTGEFEMYLQPQFSVDGKVHGAEALSRWNHRTEGIIHPTEFVPLFESNGIIASLDTFIWDQAAQQLKKWQNEGNQDLYISVNVSPKDFIYVDIYKFFTELVAKYEIPPHRLNLEITESSILINFEQQLELIDKLRVYGFRVEMDDFGSGYSSLNMLKDVTFDVIKIDMAFLQETKNKERSVKILNSIVKLSKMLNIPVISEGVETKEQLDLLNEIGADLYQGFFFSEPIKVQEFYDKYVKPRT